MTCKKLKTSWSRMWEFSMWQPRLKNCVKLIKSYRVASVVWASCGWGNRVRNSHWDCDKGTHDKNKYSLQQRLRQCPVTHTQPPATPAHPQVSPWLVSDSSSTHCRAQLFSISIWDKQPRKPVQGDILKATGCTGRCPPSNSQLSHGFTNRAKFDDKFTGLLSQVNSWPIRHELIIFARIVRWGFGVFCLIGFSFVCLWFFSLGVVVLLLFCIF